MNTQKNQKQYFEYIGRITVQFSVLELMGLQLLAYLVNSKDTELGYFIAIEYHNKTSQKFDLIKKIISNEPYKTLLTSDIKKLISNTLDEVDKTRVLRNKIIHGIIIFNNNIGYADILGFDKNIKKLKVVKKIEFEELTKMFMDIMNIQINLQKILEDIKEIMNVNKKSP